MNFLVRRNISQPQFLYSKKPLSINGILKISFCIQEFGHELEAHQGGNKLMFLISNQQLPSGMASENDLGPDSGMKTSRKQKRNKRRLQLPGATDLFKIE